MNSNEFKYQEDAKIDGKTKAEWEAEFEVVGLIHALEELGWIQYQWNKYADEEAARFNDHRCFSEFFSPYFKGYLRGDGATVREAVERCLAVAQRYAACERTNNHEYVPFRVRNGEEYDNGLLMCKKCGFAGHTNMVGELTNKIGHLEYALAAANERAASEIQHFKEKGKTFEQSIRESIGAIVDHAAMCVAAKEPK